MRCFARPEVTRCLWLKPAASLGSPGSIFYRLERMFMQRGYVAFLGSSMGRRPLLALNQEIVNFIIHRKLEQPHLSGENLRQEILRLYKVDCSRRTVERIVEKTGLSKKGSANIDLGNELGRMPSPVVL